MMIGRDPMTDQPLPMRGPSLQVDAVCRRNVGPISFSAEPGESVAITGRSGSGKSTVAGIVAGCADRGFDPAATLDETIELYENRVRRVRR